MAGSRPVLRLLGRGSALIVWSSRESAEPRHFPRRVLLKTQCYVNFKVTKCPVEFVSGESKNGLLPFERHYSRLDNVGRATVKCSFCDYIPYMICIRAVLQRQKICSRQHTCEQVLVVTVTFRLQTGVFLNPFNKYQITQFYDISVYLATNIDLQRKPGDSVDNLRRLCVLLCSIKNEMMGVMAVMVDGVTNRCGRVPTACCAQSPLSCHSHRITVIGFREMTYKLFPYSILIGRPLLVA